jgi:hypothetical protein
MKNAFFVGLLALALSACGMSPKHLNTRGHDASSVKVINLPLGTQVSVGGRTYEADARGVVLSSLPDGWYDLSIMSDRRVVANHKIFLQDGTQKVIDFNVK